MLVFFHKNINASKILDIYEFYKVRSKCMQINFLKYSVLRNEIDIFFSNNKKIVLFRYDSKKMIISVLAQFF